MAVNMNKNSAFAFDCFAVFFENQNQSMILEPRFSKIQIDLTYALFQIPLLNNSIQTTNNGFIKLNLNLHPIWNGFSR